ncbi:hypothetical protein Poli38472_007978 [Pythium oligandrum]|uniref:Cyclic nucleotide-binding domain-containing protein n=1 Tax=Pythium oligandrum TaxID=41045 RepID=A0A8K1CME5_PYTOL|nr:hypothetical protein Poli38472_007978 [Pythium oligandrum]|eukprot:TMW65336.1 hypothetical protein Poli38472_007978 [Pythium oligandrum]
MARFQLAVAYEKVGRFHEALHTYREILKTDTNNAFLHFNLGNLLMKLDHVDEATVAYTMAIEKSGGASKCLHQAFYRQRGAAYRKKGDFEKAAQDYSRVQAAQRRLSSMSEIEVADMKEPQQEQFAVEDKQYTSERIFTSRLRGLTVDTEDLAPLEASNHQRVMTLACHQPDERTEHDLDFLADELRSQFSILSVFHTEAIRDLCRKLGGFRNVLPGTLVSAEGDEGGHIFLVGRGRIATYKKITHLFAPTQQSQPEDEENKEIASETTKSSIEMVSMEQLLATAADEQTRSLDEETGSLWSVVAQSATSIASNASWYQDQRMLTELARGDTCGRQGRFSQESRLYSVVAAEECDLLAVSWVAFAEAERTHRLVNSLQLSRFMSTIPLFHNIPTNELTHLARLGRDSKVIGSRVICSEDQYVNGLIIVREGELCQLHPSDLARPPNLLVGFNLSGSISVNRDSPEQSGLHFFTQLEFADDSLFFAHDSAMMHGFLPQDLVSNTLKALRNALDERLERSDDPASRVEATSIQRGGFFSASSSWIPPRKSRETAITSAGVTCAKNTLISISSASLLFFTPADLIEALSPSSRSLLQKNMTEITTPHATLSRSDPIALATKRAEPHSHRMLLKPPSGRDLMRRYEHDIHWQRYKSEIVKVVIEDKERRKANFIFNRRNSVQRSTR